MIFSVKKGNHHSDNLLYKIFSFFNTHDRVSYFVTFNKSAIYSDETNDKFDVNKLFGFSIGGHHNNSHRFGWNCLDGKIKIYAYSYINGERIINDVCSVNPDETYNFIIKIRGSKCIFSVINETYLIKQAIVEIPNKFILGYALWPYFGGNKRAPQKISIELTKN